MIVRWTLCSLVLKTSCLGRIVLGLLWKVGGERKEIEERGEQPSYGGIKSKKVFGGKLVNVEYTWRTTDSAQAASRRRPSGPVSRGSSMGMPGVVRRRR